MAKDVLVNAGVGEVRVAVLDDGVLDQLWLERTIGLEDSGKRPGAGNGGRRAGGCSWIGSESPLPPVLVSGSVLIDRWQRRSAPTSQP